MRLKDRVAIVVGAGQSPGEGMGNGRATALTFAREGAKVLCVDHNLASAEETVAMIEQSQGTAVAFKADVTKDAEIKAMVADAHQRWGRIDILHNNVGVSISGGDAELLDITEEAFDRCVAINLKSVILACKHVIPIMRQQKSGAIVNISSMAVLTTYPYVAYKATKAAMVSFTEQLAYQNAQYGIRANVILPGLMNTPMAVDTPLVGDAQMRDHRQSEEGHLQEGLVQGRAHGRHRLPQLAQALLDLLERLVAHQAGDGQRQFGDHLAVRRRHGAALDLDQPVHRHGHIRIGATDDADIVAVVADRRGDGAPPEARG